MREQTGQEGQCEAADVSLEGMFVTSEIAPQIGERVIVYIDNLGRFEGRVARSIRGGFGLAVSMPPRKRQKLETQLMWLSRLAAKAVHELRSFQRVVPARRLTTLRTAAGLEVSAMLMDMARGGASFVSLAPFKIGDRILVGRTPAHVISISKDRVAVQFVEAIPEDRFSDSVEL